MERNDKPTLVSFVRATDENLDYVEKQLEQMKLPLELLDPLRYEFKRIRGRCKGMLRHAAKLDMMLGLVMEEPDGLYVDPPVLRRDSVLFQNQFREQIRGLEELVRKFQGLYDEWEDWPEMKTLAILLYETMGNIIYLFTRARYVIGASIADLSATLVD